MVEVHIEDAADDFIKGIEEFVEKYKEKHVEHPDHYPLTLDIGNSGLWNEFIIEYVLRGNV